MNHNTSNPTAKIKKKGDIECCKNCAGGKCKTQDEVQLSNEEETFSDRQSNYLKTLYFLSI